MKVGIIAPDCLAYFNKKILNELGLECVHIKESKDLVGINGLIISACIQKEIDQLVNTLHDELSCLFAQPFVVMGIGDGVPFLAKNGIFNIIGIEIATRHKLIPETILVNIPTIGDKRFVGVDFNHISICALDPNIGVLSKDKIKGPLIVRQGNYIACTFTAELSSDFCLYQYFKKMLCDATQSDEIG